MKSVSPISENRRRAFPEFQSPCPKFPSEVPIRRLLLNDVAKYAKLLSSSPRGWATHDAVELFRSANGRCKTAVKIRPNPAANGIVSERIIVR